jgi:hypothetical protein
MIAFFAMQWVQAATICDAKTALANARLNLMMMVVSTEKAEQDALKVDIDKASIELEKAMTAMLKDENKIDDVQLKTLKKTWTQFKNTRETEIVPAVYAGDNQKAIGIATGVQAGRMKIMNGVIRELNGDNCDY